MATDELDVQRHIAEGCNRFGGYGFKNNNKFLAGIPDLFLSSKKHGPMMIEVKLLKGTESATGVSPIQVSTMKKLKAAGCATGLLAVRRLDVGRWSIYASRNPEKYFIDNDFQKWVKERGQSWPVEEIMDYFKGEKV